MPRTSGTRTGNGGWGGRAKGAGNHSAGPGRGATHRSVAEIMAAASAREIAAAAWLAILNDPSHPKHAEMVAKASDRMDGTARQSVDLSVIDKPLDEMTDEELLAIAARGRRRDDRASEGEE